MHLSDLIDEMEEAARDDLRVADTSECKTDELIRVLCFLRMCMGTLTDFVQIAPVDTHVHAVASNLLIAAEHPFDPWDEEVPE